MPSTMPLPNPERSVSRISPLCLSVSASRDIRPELGSASTTAWVLRITACKEEAPGFLKRRLRVRLSFRHRGGCHRGSRVKESPALGRELIVQIAKMLEDASGVGRACLDGLLGTGGVRRDLALRALVVGLLELEGNEERVDLTV